MENSRSWQVAGVGLALLTALVGVGVASGAAPTPTVQTEGLRISLTTAPSPPVRQEGTSFEISIRDASGNPVAGARVSLDLNMPAHAMGDNSPRVLERGAGRYLASGSFSMGGEWQAAVEVVLAEGRRVRAVFPLRVR